MHGVALSSFVVATSYTVSSCGQSASAATARRAICVGIWLAPIKCPFCLRIHLYAKPVSGLRTNLYPFGADQAVQILLRFPAGSPAFRSSYRGLVMPGLPVFPGLSRAVLFHPHIHAPPRLFLIRTTACLRCRAFGLRARIERPGTAARQLPRASAAESSAGLRARVTGAHGARRVPRQGSPVRARMRSSLAAAAGARSARVVASLLGSTREGPASELVPLTHKVGESPLTHISHSVSGSQILCCAPATTASPPPTPFSPLERPPTLACLTCAVPCLAALLT